MTLARPPPSPRDFHGGNILRSESDPSFEDEGAGRESQAGEGGDRFDSRLAFDTDGHETKFRFGVGIKEDL